MLDLEKPETFREVLERLQTGIYFVDRDQRILFWNDGAEKITGYLRHEVVGSFCREHLLAGGDQNKNVLSDAAASIGSVLHDGKPAIAEVSLRHKAGHRIFVRLRAVPIRNDRGTIIGAAESFEESLAGSDWDRRQSKLREYGCLDPVTGVLTDKLIVSHLRESVATFNDHAMPFSILCAEVDAVDRMRTKYGQAVVSPVLRIVAQTMENSLRPTDFLGRVGENRFLAILTECGSRDIRKTTERLRKMVNAAEVEWWGDTWSVTMSFGAATVIQGDDPASLLQRAERALSEASAAGGNCVTVGSSGLAIVAPSED